MRRIVGSVSAVLIAVVACYPDGSQPAQGDGSKRDLTTAAGEMADAPVVSELELGLRPESPKTEHLASDVPLMASPTTAESEAAEPVSAPALVSWTDGVDLAAEPREIQASLPIMGAGAGTVLNPGVTVTTQGPPVQLFPQVATRDSPWPEAGPGDYPNVDRYSPGILIYGGGHGGACPAGGRAFIGR